MCVFVCGCLTLPWSRLASCVLRIFVRERKSTMKRALGEAPSKKSCLHIITSSQAYLQSCMQVMFLAEHIPAMVDSLVHVLP